MGAARGGRMLAFGMPGMTEWVVILIIVLIFFGAGKLPQVFAQAGKGIKAFKDASEGKDPGVDDEADERPKDRKPKQIARDPDDLDDEPAGEAAPARKEKRRSGD
jgi:sec-independent protein translocase protein TatA